MKQNITMPSLAFSSGRRRFLRVISLILWMILLPSMAASQDAGALEEARKAEDRLRVLETEIIKIQAELRASQLVAENTHALHEELQNSYNLTMAVLGFVLILGGGVSLVGFYRSEKRSAEAFGIAKLSDEESSQRSGKAFDLLFAGEQQAQARATATHDQFFESSGRTLGLVNDTLTLAKEASERASAAIEKRAREMLGSLHIEAKKLVDKAAIHGDDRYLVTDLNVRSELRSLARRISGFESSRIFLPVDIALTPYCKFVLGMDFHLEQQFKDAMRYWDEVTMSEDSPLPLQSQAWYWIGYELNNTREFLEAEDAFGRALKGADGTRKFELRRIQLESRFFNISDDGQLEGIITELEELYDLCHEYRGEGEIKKRLAAILRTAGNVCTQAASHYRNAGDVTEFEKYALKSQARFSQAFELDRDDKWAMYGLAQVSMWLGDKTTAVDLFKKVKPMVERESINREEPRTKVLCRTTELNCCYYVEEFRPTWEVVHAYLIEALGRVDGRLTVYSQWRNRNVSKEAFTEELKVFAERLRDG